MAEQADVTADLCGTGCGAPAVYGNDGTRGVRICRECFDGWYECGIVKPAVLKLRSVMIRAGASDEAISKALTETFGPR